MNNSNNITRFACPNYFNLHFYENLKKFSNLATIRMVSRLLSFFPEFRKSKAIGHLAKCFSLA